jgi:hypothetical protein
MKQNFELDLEQSKLFIQYFDAAMRDPEFGFLKANGSGHFENGKYTSEQSVNFIYKKENLFVVWKTIFKDSILESIENLNSLDDKNFDSLLLEFLNTILQRVLTKKKEKYFKRVLFKTISGCNLPGEYWLPGFRFAPLLPEDDSKLINAERIIVIDQTVEAIDIHHANEVALQSASIYSAYLSFILDLGIYSPIHEELYFLDQDGVDFSMFRKSSQLLDTQPIDKMPEKGAICKLGEFKNSVFDRERSHNEYLVCPKETRKILRGIADSEEHIQDAFLRCCLIYQAAINAGKQYPTIRISYLCGAVETIVKSNQKEYVSFSTFMEKYAGENKELYSLIYERIRSAHWHSGNFALGDFDFSADFTMNPDKHITFNIIRESQYRMRLAILNWLFEKLDLEKEDSG